MGENIILNPAEVLFWFVNLHPDKEPITMWDMGDRYLLYVGEKGIPEDANFNDPYYEIYKDGAAIFRFSSMGDPDLFFATIKKTPVMTRKEK